MSAIKPGSLCVIVNSPADLADEANGRIVEAVSLVRPGVWFIDAQWIREMAKQLCLAPDFRPFIEETRLRPIDDPSSATNSYYTCVVHI